MKKIFYKGYSSFEFQSNRTFKLTDIELVKMDLLNHIFTRKGERVMMSSFGTNIKDLVFEPLDADTMDTLRTELETVFNYDPRVDLLDLTLVPDYDNNSVTATAILKYVELDLIDNMNINIYFEQ